jgi:hypothetical protein
MWVHLFQFLVLFVLSHFDNCIVQALCLVCLCKARRPRQRRTPIPLMPLSALNKPLVRHNLPRHRSLNVILDALASYPGAVLVGLEFLDRCLAIYPTLICEDTANLNNADTAKEEVDGSQTIKVILALFLPLIRIMLDCLNEIS